MRLISTYQIGLFLICAWRQRCGQERRRQGGSGKRGAYILQALGRREEQGGGGSENKCMDISGVGDSSAHINQ